MKKSSIIVLFGLLALAACAPPTAEEQSVIDTAIKPSSQKAAEAAVVRYMDGVLIDGPSARYKFREPVKGSLIKVRAREFGWFMCGEVNSRNRMGGYSGYQTFLVHFSPTQRDVVTEAYLTPEDFELDTTAMDCSNLYGSQK